MLETYNEKVSTVGGHRFESGIEKINKQKFRSQPKF